MRLLKQALQERALLVFAKKKAPPELTFHTRLAALRKEGGLTQLSDNGGSNR